MHYKYTSLSKQTTKKVYILQVKTSTVSKYLELY